MRARPEPRTMLDAEAAPGTKRAAAAIQGDKRIPPSIVIARRVSRTPCLQQIMTPQRMAQLIVGERQRLRGQPLVETAAAERGFQQLALMRLASRLEVTAVQLVVRDRRDRLSLGLHG